MNLFKKLTSRSRTISKLSNKSAQKSYRGNRSLSINRSPFLNKSLKSRSVPNNITVSNREKKQILSIEKKFEHSINIVNDYYIQENETELKMDPILITDIMQGFPYLKQNKKLASYFLSFVYSNHVLSLDWFIFISNIKNLLKNNEINKNDHKILIKHIRNFCIFWKSAIRVITLTQLTPRRKYEKNLLEECDELLSIL